MKKTISVLLLSLIVLTISAQRYTIDPSHTAVTSKVLRFGVVKVVGRFTAVSGIINFNVGNPAITTADIVIRTDSYIANNAGGEDAVKSPTFLDAKSFPEIKMTVKRLTKNGQQFIVLASLTIHGVTKDVLFPASINGPLLDLPTQKQSIGISGTLVINRDDFGIKMSGRLPSGNDVIGKEVEIEINALAIAG
ncbi:YceI family protein [soil metagenome]